jgi:PAS domain S-box-containing protein
MVGKKLGEVLTRGVHAVDRASTFRGALLIMREKKISMLVVMDANGPVGVITERDVICAMASGMRVDDVKAEDVMSAPVVTATTDMDIYDAHAIFGEKGIHHVVVVSPVGASVEGVVTQTDIIRHLGPEYFIELKSVSRVMDRNFRIADATEAVSDVIRGMTSHAHGMAVVVDDGRRPVGVITERDAVRLLHEGIDASRAVARDVMNSPAVTVREDSTLVKALSVMTENGFRRIVVVDPDGAVSGVVTQKEILTGLESAYIKELREMARSLGERLKLVSEDLNGKTALLNGLFSGAVENVRLVTDADMNVKYYSPAAELIFGMALEEVRGKSLADIYRKMGIDGGIAAIGEEEVIKHGEYIFTIANETAIGGKFLECKLAAINDDDGRPAAYALFCRDVTEARNERDMARCVMDASHELLCMVDLDGRFEYVNGAWKERLGYERSNLLSRRFMDFVLPEDRERTTEAFKRILAGEPLGPFENRYMASDGSTRRLSWRVYTPGESDRHVYGIATDVTESRQAEADRDMLAGQLKSTLSGSGALPRWIPICSYCRKIRDEEGMWWKFEMYISERTGSDFTHGICEPCAKKLMDEAKR